MSNNESTIALFPTITKPILDILGKLPPEIFFDVLKNVFHNYEDLDSDVYLSIIEALGEYLKWPTPRIIIDFTFNILEDAIDILPKLSSDKVIDEHYFFVMIETLYNLTGVPTSEINEIYRKRLKNSILKYLINTSNKDDNSKILKVLISLP